MSNAINDRKTPSKRRMHATPALSKMIELLVADWQASGEPTLADIRSALVQPHVFWSGEGELLHAQDQTTLVIELDELIECCGAQACARNFVDRKAPVGGRVALRPGHEGGIMRAPLVENYDRHPEVPLDFAVVREAVRHNHCRTPFLLLDPELIRTKVHRFRAAMPSVMLHYAIKANPHPEILRLMLEEGVHFEVASLAELEVLLDLGVAANEVHFNNPVKPRESVIAAARAGVAWYVADTVEELNKIVEVKRDAQLCVRIETQNIGSDWPLTGKFGATLPEVDEMLQRARELDVAVSGVAFHVGSQCRNLDNWRIGAENARRVFDLMHSYDMEPRLLNIGGGFPVRHRKPIPGIEKIGASVNSVIATLPPNIRVMAEPGRFLVSDCAWLVTRVIGTAVRRGTRWIYLDAGIYQGMMEALGGLEYEIRTDRHDAEVPCTVAGPTCDSTDVIARDRSLPQDLREGDYVYVPNAGAYTTAYATHFNGLPAPDTVLLQQIYA